ncbi:MAG: TetR/AcrR family transcriptional regulator [Oscillospiraceae bacterium]|nr:TetR/AcrR family transcriptional regulator [Oscillospiraceae bacterium]
MSNKKAAQRSASNRRILDSALREFAEKGFSRALLINIAKNAGVSNGMITQRFNGKENLYKQVFVDIISTYLTKFSESDSLHKMLITIVDDIKRGAVNSTDTFVFISDLLLSKDPPVDSFDQVRDVFCESVLCSRLSEAINNGLVRQGAPFDLIRSFLVSAVGISKSFNETSVGLPSSSGFLSLLAPSDKFVSGDPDYMRSRLTEELIGQLSYEYEAVVLVNLDTDTFIATKAVGVFSSSYLPQEQKSFDENVMFFTEGFVHPDDRQYYRDIINKDSLLRRFDPDARLTIRYRTNQADDVYYQTIVRFNTASEDGHWITIGIKNIDRLVHEEVRNALSEAQGRSASLTDRLSGVFDVIAYLDTAKDELTFYTLRGDFGMIAGRISKSDSGTEDLVRLISALSSDSDRKDLADRIRKTVSVIHNDTDKIRYIPFYGTVDLRRFRCTLEIAALTDRPDALVIGIMDFDKHLELGQ